MLGKQNRKPPKNSIHEIKQRMGKKQQKNFGSETRGKKNMISISNKCLPWKSKTIKIIVPNLGWLKYPT